MAEANTGQGGRADPLNVKNPRTNVNFLSRRAKSERLCVGFETQGCQSAAAACDVLSLHGRPDSGARRHGPAGSSQPYAICTRRLYTSRPKSKHSSEKSIVSV